MAVILEIDATLEELMQKLGCASALTASAKANGLSVKYSLKGVVVTGYCIESDTTYHSEAPIMMGVLQQILGGSMPTNASKSLLKVKLEQAVKTVLLDVGQKLEDTAPAFLSGQVKAPVNSDLQVPLSKAPQNLESIFGGKPKFGGGEVKQKGSSGGVTGAVKSGNLAADMQSLAKHADPALKCKLIDATELLQPVSGTSASSTYYCVAIHHQLKVAVRIKNNQKIAIRVEGNNLGQFKTQMTGVGLDGSDDHYSMHVSCDSPTLARKTVGAVLYGLGLNFEKMSTDLTSIWGKG